MSGTKLRVRVPAGSAPAGKSFVGDSFQNFAAQLGYGAQNLSSSNTYGFNPITRNRVALEYMYRGSWIVKQIVDAVADDMTRAGTSIDSEMPPEDMEKFHRYWQEMVLWQRINATIKWSRLYGGAVAVMMIAGQRMDTELQTDTIMKDQFKGLIVMDRWMVWPSLTETVTEIGPDFGQPMYYEIVADVRGLPRMRIHHSRVIRMDGVELPYWQTIAENGWSLSVIEPLLDRLVAFDSVTQGAAQLAFKAHLRVIRVDGLRELIATGGMVYQAFLQQMAMIRLMQSNEGMTVIDKEDEFQANTYTFAGLPDLLAQFGQQLSGASQIPLTRLFGQSPGGMNATGESDMRNYYDSIKAQQEARLRRPLTVLYDVTHRSLFGRPLPKDFQYNFAPLWQLQDGEKATIAAQVTGFVDQAKAGGLITSELALKELRQSAKITGYWSNITDEDLKQAKMDDLLPQPTDMQGGDPPAPGEPGQQAPEGNAKPPSAPKPEPDAEADDSEPATLVARPVRRRNTLVAQMFPNTKGWTSKDLPTFAKPQMRDKAEVTQTYGHLTNGRDINHVRGLYRTHDGYPMRDIHGLTVVIETAKGERRTGYGWAANVAADYGYISGTSSAEGDTEQMDCFIGDDPDSDKAYIIEQQHPITNQFDEHKCMLCFKNKEAAIDAYVGSFSDDNPKKRIGRVLTMSTEALRAWLDTNWKYGQTVPAQPEADK